MALQWTDKQNGIDTIDASDVNALANGIKANENAIDRKQDTLVSGTNIKTINSTSVLGSGDIEITAPIQSISVDNVQQTPDENGNVDINLSQKQNVEDDDLATGANTIVGAINELEEKKEENTNKVTYLSSSSTDTQYPSAKVVYDELQKKSDILIRTLTKSGGSITDIDDYIPSKDLLNYQMWGNISQETQPFSQSTNPRAVEPLFVGDKVDSGTYDGKYKIPITNYNFDEFDIYLNEPLREIWDAEYSSNNQWIKQSDVFDTIDYKTGKVKRRVGKISYTPSSITTETAFSGTSLSSYNYFVANEIYIRSTTYLNKMRTTHTGFGNSKMTDVRSNALQYYQNIKGTYGMSNHFIITFNTTVYFYWNLNKLGFTVTPDASATVVSGYTLTYDDNGTTKTVESVDEIKAKITEYFTNNNVSSIDVYYPLACTEYYDETQDHIVLPTVTMPETEGEEQFDVDTVLKPSKISIQYYADLPKTIEDIYTKLETLENAILAQGGNV